MSVLPAGLRSRLISPAGVLGIGLVAALVVGLLPDAWSVRLKDAAAVALRPGQQAALAARRHGEQAVARVRAQFQNAGRLAETEGGIDRLARENRALKAQLLAALATRSSADEPRGAEPLLRVRTVRGRVLGRQARSFLQRKGMLDVGSDAGVSAEDLVLPDAAAIIDWGEDADLQPQWPVLAGGCVWGKVDEVGRHASSVLRVTEPGYRDVVRIAGPQASHDALKRAPQGILEGTGEPLARIRRVDVTEPVEVGDVVYTAGGQGVVDRPLVYGHVARVERPVGASHWDIWVQPAVAPDEPKHVIVVCTEVNPLRVASKNPQAPMKTRH
jgi:cell shape-determining protein MreC